MYGLLWKDNIIKQAQDREMMAAARKDPTLVQAADAVLELGGSVQAQNIVLYEIGDEYNNDDTDEEFLDPDNSNELDVLAALMETCGKGKVKANPMNKNQQIIQECVEKEK